MSPFPRFSGAVVSVLAAVRRRAARAIAAETPADVTVTLIGDDIALTGRALSVRAATDGRLHDFAAIVRGRVMSTAALALQKALIATLSAAPGLAGLTGLYDGPPADAAFPFLAVSDGATTDWSTKSGQGREHRLSIAIWDDGAVPARLHTLLAAADDAIGGLPRDLDGHRIVSLAFLRSRIVRGAAEPWVARSDWRVRTVAT